MRTRSPKSLNTDELRRKAEAQLHQDIEQATRSEMDTETLLHELQVHQVELDMQNDELRRATLEAEELARKYGDLYDFAPVSFLTLDAQGHILEINLTGAALLGVGRR